MLIKSRSRITRFAMLPLRRSMCPKVCFTEQEKIFDLPAVLHFTENDTAVSVSGMPRQLLDTLEARSPAIFSIRKSKHSSAVISVPTKPPHVHPYSLPLRFLPMYELLGEKGAHYYIISISQWILSLKVNLQNFLQ